MNLFSRSILLLLLCLSLPVAAEGQKVQEYTLDNGLKLLVREDHRAPVVVSQVWYKVGSSYEYGGITGISHVLEHMMFKGTENHPPGEFSRIIAENGGRENAFTGRDYTAYFQSLEKSRLGVSFELEADRMRHLRLLDDEFSKELQVVLEERRLRTDDQPRAKTYEHFMSMAFSNSPYKNPVIGWPADIKALQLRDLQQWYFRWYAPNNATVVVVGDVAPNEVLNLARRYFGKLRPSKLKPLKPQVEIEQLGKRQMRIRVPAKLPYLLMGYKVPALKDSTKTWEPYALEVLASILDGGRSARLSTRLVRGRQIAVAAGAGYDLYSRLPSMLSLDATPVQGVSLEQLEQALKEEVKDLQETLVSDEELARIKAQVLADAIYERDSMFYQAMQMGMLETVGLGWETMDDYVKQVSAVTAEQVRQVAQKYLVNERYNVAYLDPLPIKNNKISTAPRLGGRHAQ